jgi:hypothetical protein
MDSTFFKNLTIESLALTVLENLNKISRACKTVYKDEKPLTSGTDELSELYKQFKPSVFFYLATRTVHLAFLTTAWATLPSSGLISVSPSPPMTMV